MFVWCRDYIHSITFDWLRKSHSWVSLRSFQHKKYIGWNVALKGKYAKNWHSNNGNLKILSRLNSSESPCHGWCQIKHLSILHVIQTFLIRNSYKKHVVFIIINKQHSHPIHDFCRLSSCILTIFPHTTYLSYVCERLHRDMFCYVWQTSDGIDYSRYKVCCWCAMYVLGNGIYRITC